MFSRAEVEAIAALANLELDESEIEMFARQLGEILAYVDEVQQVDTSGIPPTASVLTRHSADRPDRVHPSLTPREALANAPDPVLDPTPDRAPGRPPDHATSGGLFRVPRVIG
jgi:aspartyl-tRNA(Asn)/glutamyl-tRNA(Gln) amidotransferase subunit C